MLELHRLTPATTTTALLCERNHVSVHTVKKVFITKFIISQLHKRNNFNVDAFHIAPQSLTLVMVARMEEEQFELDAVLKRMKILYQQHL